MSMSNELYDRLKWVALVLLPALAVLAAGLGDIYQLPATDLGVATINLWAVFLGSVLQLSSQNYHQGGGDSHDYSR